MGPTTATGNEKLYCIVPAWQLNAWARGGVEGREEEGFKRHFGSMIEPEIFRQKGYDKTSIFCVREAWNVRQTAQTNLSLKLIWFCIPIEMASFYGEAGEGVSRERQFRYTRKNGRSVKYPTSLTGDK